MLLEGGTGASMPGGPGKGLCRQPVPDWPTKQVFTFWASDATSRIYQMYVHEHST